MTQDLKNLRKILRAQRRQLAPSSQVQAALLITQQILKLPIFQHSQKIAFYLAADGEIDLDLLIKAAQQQNKICYLPKVNIAAKEMLFLQYQLQDQLLTSEFGVLEPEFALTKTVAPNEIDLVITPLVGFNAQRHRLGRGGGFYDRAFAHKLKAPQAKPYLLGVAHAVQRIEFTPNDWDVPLDKIVVA